MLPRIARAYVILATLVLLASIFLDPYSFHLNASDAVVLAPWWQILSSVVSFGLLCGVLLMVWLDRPSLVVTIATAEALLHLALNMMLIARDGFSRYQVGFGGLEVDRLITHFGVLGLRVTVIYAAALILLGETRRKLDLAG